MNTLVPNAALILIDIQQGLDAPHLGERNNPQAERNIAALLAAWRERHMPIIHVKHNSTSPTSTLRPELPGNAFKPEAAPQGDEPIITKQVNNAFVGTDLETRLRDADINTLVIIGLTTDHCVSTTARMGGDLGFVVYVVEDATATHSRTGYDGAHYDADTIHRTALVSLKDEFATITSAEAVIEALPQTTR